MFIGAGREMVCRANESESRHGPRVLDLSPSLTPLHPFVRPFCTHRKTCTVSNVCCVLPPPPSVPSLSRSLPWPTRSSSPVSPSLRPPPPRLLQRLGQHRTHSR